MEEYNENEDIVLGWKVNETLDPNYWLDLNAIPGKQKLEDLFIIDRSKIAKHTAIIAQSGSGKSFLLGRLIEEIVIKTKSNCVILDPNADFRNIHSIEKSKVWEEAKYNIKERRGKLPHEPSVNYFAKIWDQIPKKVRTGVGVKGKNFEELKIFWPSVSFDFIIDDENSIQKMTMFHCHNFLRSVAIIISLSAIYYNRQLDLLSETKSLLEKAKLSDYKAFKKLLDEKYNIENFLDDLLMYHTVRYFFSLLEDLTYGLKTVNYELTKFSILKAIDRLIYTAFESSKYIDPSLSNIYFGKAKSFESSGMFINSKEDLKAISGSSDFRIEVIDLPSISERNYKLLVINEILSNQWAIARENWSSAMGKEPDNDDRVPTFIIIDEAHNIIPTLTTNRIEETLKEQVKKIIAEGRKYGLFLIIISQRPDKLDPQIISECENKLIMKIGSKSVLNVTKKLLGLEDISEKVINKCLDFPMGRALIAGDWVSNPEIFYSATRRTIEGGRNLKKEFWTKSELV